MMLQNRSQRTLTDVIQRNVKVGTTVISDGWRGYCGLSGYPHYTVIHRNNFVDPETGMYIKS